MDPLDLVGSWASVMMDRASQCRTRWLQARNIQDDSVRTANLLVATDCSGADAPMFALEGLNIRVKQMFACDVALHCLRFLDFRSVSRGQDPDLYSNMLKRDHESLKDINAYYCGFPCKPWSTLNNFSKYFESPDFLPFKEMITVMVTKRPGFAVFENVEGLLPFIEQVAWFFRDLKGYVVLYFRLCPTMLGHSVRRQRVYFVALRKDLLIVDDTQSLCQLGQEILRVMHRPLQATLLERLLRPGHPLLETYKEPKPKCPAPRPPKLKRRLVVKTTVEKWRCEHKRIREELRGQREAQCLDANTDGWSERAKDVLQLAWDRHRKSDMCIDVSQSIQRSKISFGGYIPCITPGACIYSVAANRVISSVEVMLLQGFPLHELEERVPVSCSALKKLAGNSMHVEAVGAASLVALSLLCVADLNRGFKGDSSECDEEEGVLLNMMDGAVVVPVSPELRPKIKESKNRVKSKKSKGRAAKAKAKAKAKAGAKAKAKARHKKIKRGSKSVQPKTLKTSKVWLKKKSQLKRSDSGWGRRMALHRAYSVY
ncbi:unnamed protein product [Symbiodinium natans]|uniref:Uncharacterized protein n=1 Tax=Symbiodinium natans TaxID=878477 RepID=A0A812UG45_9DINO|nr:unnamed protein product [Symbiodinium natans]